MKEEGYNNYMEYQVGMGATISRGLITGIRFLLHEK